MDNVFSFFIKILRKSIDYSSVVRYLTYFSYCIILLMKPIVRLIRVTTVDLSLHVLLEGQLGFLNREFEVVGVATDTGALKYVGELEEAKVI